MRKMFTRQQGPVIPNALRRFRTEEDGMSAPLILMFFTTMILIGGIAMDVARFEHQRVAVQNTLDRAALAAANLDQGLDPEAVVQDFFDKAGYGDTLRSVDVVRGAGNSSRTVTIEAEARTYNYFMQWMDIDQLAANSATQAEQKITDIEIMMVLDVSGSMGEQATGGGTKLAALKVAATEFVDTVMGANERGRVSIGIVPYNAQVNIGQALASQFNIQNRINTVLVPRAIDYACIEIPTTLFGAVALSQTTPMSMMTMANVTSTTGGSGSYVNPPSVSPSWCRNNIGSMILLPTKDAATVNTRIAALQANGNTSILLGMRWGTALLDPAARPVYNALISAGLMNSNMSDRPYNYMDPNDIAARSVSKIVILMTDGAHVAHNRVLDAYKTGTSPIYRNPNDDRYSVYHPRRSGNKYWVPHNGTWQSGPWGGAGVAVQLDYAQVWDQVSVNYAAYQFFGRAGQYTTTSIGNTSQQSAAFSGQYASASSMDSLLRANCTAARNAGMIIYGIAFEAPASGQTAIRNCVSIPETSYYFNAQGTSIRAVFRLIAAQITQLRLTQ